MPILYSYWFEHREECYRVLFHDIQTDIIKAESLGQICHAARRKWALELIEFFNDKNVIQLLVNLDGDSANEFSNRLYEEKWTPCVVRFENSPSQSVLHVYRSYLIIYLLFKTRLKS